jgi:hypothetical protein
MSRYSFPTTEMVNGVTYYVSGSTITCGASGTTRSVMFDTTFQHLIAWDGFVSASLAASGAGGLDTGSEDNNTWYAVLVIADTSGANPVTLLLTKTPDSPTMPSGYDVYRRVWWVRNDNLYNIKKFEEIRTGKARVCGMDVERPTMQPLSGGNATTYTSVDLGPYMPPGSRLFYGIYAFDAQTATDEFRVRPTGSTVSVPCTTFAIGQTAPTAIGTFVVQCVCPTRYIDYEVDRSNDSLDIYICAYEDNVG